MPFYLFDANYEASASLSNTWIVLQHFTPSTLCVSFLFFFVSFLKFAISQLRGRLFPNFEVMEFRRLDEKANKNRELNRELMGRNLNCREIVNTFLFYRYVRRTERKSDKVKITMNVELQWGNVYMLLR